jgi:GTP-binding protein
MEIRSVTFQGACLRASDRPGDWFPQVAVAGRSNVGKSSLLNWVFNRSLARVAKAPGKTRTLNFYLVNRNLYLVDLPGYGYAKVARKLRDQWGRELGAYLAREKRLAGVITLIDIRHPPSALDLELQGMLLELGLDTVVVLTKADKLPRGRRQQRQRELQSELTLPYLPLATSVTAGDGRRELLATVARLADGWRQSQQEKVHGTEEEEHQG